MKFVVKGSTCVFLFVTLGFDQLQHICIDLKARQRACQHVAERLQQHAVFIEEFV